MIAHTLYYSHSSTITHGKALSGPAGRKQVASGCAIKHRIANNNIIIGDPARF
jgi:hypothetical protein